MAAADKKKLAALVVVLLALLAGPAAGFLGSGVSCTTFVGWPVLSLVNSLICGILGGPSYTPPVIRKDPPTGRDLSVGYYSNSSNKDSYCSNDVEAAVRKAVENAIGQQGRGIGAGLIRLFFHDAFVRGCDASVLLSTTATGNSDTERTGPPNANSLRGFEVIDAAKKATKDACDGRNVVSCADILAFAARDAARNLSYGAIDYKVPAGRYDGRESFASETNSLPGPDSTLQQLVKMFDDQGLDERDMVTLSGAHSIGRVRCVFFTNRLSEMDPAYADELRQECNGNGNTQVDQDDRSPDELDNQYYKNILDKHALFGSDAALNSSDATRKQVKDNVANPSTWYGDFAAAMVKMGNIGVKTSPGDKGQFEIRDLCSRINSP